MRLIALFMLLYAVSCVLYVSARSLWKLLRAFVSLFR